MRLARYADEPDLRAIRYETLSQQTFPEYLQNNVPGNKYWSRLYEDFPDFQLALLDGDELVAELHSVPTPWDGTDDDLPSGWDEAFVNAFESGREPTVLSALAISVRPDRQSKGLAAGMLEEMRGAAAAGGLRELIAPVRPTLKARYPLIPIERYLEWRRPDGTHFDPWIRVHERIGGRAALCARRPWPSRRAERLATAPALAALALAGPLELATHLAVLRDVLCLVGSRVHVGLALRSAESGERLLGTHRIAGDARPFQLLHGACELRVLALERRLRGFLHQAPDERQLHHEVEDRLQVAAVLDPAEKRERPQHEQQSAEDVEREEVEPDRRGHGWIVAQPV